MECVHRKCERVADIAVTVTFPSLTISNFLFSNLTVVVLGRNTPEEFHNACHCISVTHWPGYPALLKVVIKHPETVKLFLVWVMCHGSTFSKAASLSEQNNGDSIEGPLMLGVYLTPRESIIFHSGGLCAGYKTFNHFLNLQPWLPAFLFSMSWTNERKWNKLRQKFYIIVFF